MQKSSKLFQRIHKYINHLSPYWFLVPLTMLSAIWVWFSHLPLVEKWVCLLYVGDALLIFIIAFDYAISILKKYFSTAGFFRSYLKTQIKNGIKISEMPYHAGAEGKESVDNYIKKRDSYQWWRKQIVKRIRYSFVLPISTISLKNSVQNMSADCAPENYIAITQSLEKDLQDLKIILRQFTRVDLKEDFNEEILED
jgi:hypothetical protein